MKPVTSFQSFLASTLDERLHRIDDHSRAFQRDKVPAILGDNLSAVR